MFGIVLATHGEVAPALLTAAESIVGPLGRVRALTLEAGSDPVVLKRRIQEAISSVDDGSGVLVLCDMFGGTPSNVCLSSEYGTHVEVVTGLNLPMVLKVATMRSGNTALSETAGELAEYGRKHITHATALLRQRRAEEEARVVVSHLTPAPR